MTTLVRHEAHWYRRLRRIVYAVSGGLLLLVWSVVGIDLSGVRAQKVHELQARTESLSQVYAGYVERILGHMDTALLLLRDAYLRDHSPDNQEFARITNLLRRGPLQDVALQVAVIGPDGFLEFSDLRRPEKPVDLSDRAHFRVHLHSAVDMLYISKPVKGRVSGRWSIQLTRRISNDSGKFLGVVVLSVSPEVFAAAGPTMGLSAGDVLTLLDSDVNVLARFPSDDAALGRPLPDNVKAVIQSSAAPRLRASGVDGKVRMIGYRALNQYPLLAGVSLDTSAMDAAIFREDWSRTGAAALFSLLILIATVVSLRSLHQRQLLGRELWRQRRYFSDAQAVAQLGSWEWQPPDRLEWSEGVFRIFGLESGGQVPTLEAWRALVHPDDRPRIEEAFLLCREQGAPYHVEYRLLTGDGAPLRVVLERGAVERGEGGQVLRLYGMVMDITDQRRLEASLRDAEQRLGWALEAARDGVWDWRMDTDTIYFSPRWKGMLGYRQDEFENSIRAWHAAVHPQDLPRMQRALDDYFAGRTGRYECEFRMRCKDGSYRWILARGQIFRHDAEGRPLRMLGTHSDITDRKDAEQALRIERSRLAEAQAVAHLGSWEWDVPSGRLWWSRETYRIFGLPVSFEPALDSFKATIPPEDRARLEEALQRSREGRENYDIEHRIRRPDGEVRVVREQGRFEFDDSGAPLRMIGVVQDLTEAHRLEQALSDADARWMFALDGAGTGVWDWDMVADKTFYSRRWKEMLGFEPQDIGDSLDEWLSRVHPDDIVRVRQALDTHLAGKTQAYASEHRLRAKDGHYCWVLDRGRVVTRDEAGKALRMIGTHTDITARKEAEMGLQRSEDRYRTLIASMAEGVVLQDEHGAITLCNDAACRLLGMPPGQLVGENLTAEHWAAVDDAGKALDAARHPVRLTLAGQQARAMVLGLRRRDGHRVWLSMNCQPLALHSAGTPREVVTTFADVTRVKEAEFASRLGDTVVEQTSQPIVVTDRSGVILRANPAFCRSFGYRLDELRGRQVGAVVHSGRQDTKFYRQMWQALGEQGTWSGEIWNRRRNGEEFPEWLSITAVRDVAGNIEQFVGVYTDITERKNLETAMWRAANYDALTDLPNRLNFDERLRAGIARARRTQSRLALLFVDLDRFKPVNDTYGHYAGDLVLQTVARRLVACVREDDVVARRGGDEFVVMLQSLGDDSPIERVVHGLQTSLCMPVDIGGKDVSVGCSIGVARYPEEGESAEELMRSADAAMYAVKQQHHAAAAPGEAH